MAISEVRLVSSIRTPDDAPLFVIRKDLSGGINTRQDANAIGENQAMVLYNVDLGVLGKSTKRPGSVLIGNDVGADSPLGLHNFEIQGADDQLLMYEDTTLWKWTGSGDWTSLKADFTTSTEVGMVSGKESGLSPDDVVIIQNGVNNAFRVDSAGNFQDLGNTNTSPPITTVGAWYGNRFWFLKNDILNYSDAYDSDYSGAFDRTTNAFRVPVGEERAIIATRDTGLVIFGREQIWGFAPSTTPAATDQPQPLVTNFGAVSKNGVVAYGDNIYFFAPDGLRELKRTIQDKLQTGANYPLSYRLKDEFDRISWAYISRLAIEVFDNKVFISVPTSSTAFDTWIYYPAQDSFMVITGWSPRCWSRFKINGEEFVYYGKQGDGKAYQAWTGYTDEGTTTTNGTAITYQEEGRKEDLGQPLIEKVGGEVEIKALATGDYDISVYASFDESDYQLLGTINLSADEQTLPLALPFTLNDLDTVKTKFHLDSYGSWRTIQLKLLHSATNGTDEISVYERNIVTFQEPYLNE
jgi:hypothetical protein